MARTEALELKVRDHYYVLGLLIINLIVFRIATRLYGDQFIFMRDAISDLGATVTRTGHPNPHSAYAFIPGMVVSGIHMIVFSRYLKRMHQGDRSGRPRLALLAALGFFVMPAPHNLPVYHYMHMMGAAFIFFAFWVLSMGYLRDCKKLGMHGVYWVGMIVLQVTILTYAFLFAIDSPVKQVAQGFSLVGLIATLVVSSYAKSRGLCGAVADDYLLNQSRR